MKRIVVTGGAGRLGVEVVSDLLSRGYEVIAVDQQKPLTMQCRFLPADLTDAGCVFDVLAGADAVIHLAAIPGPVSHPPSVTFRNNVMSTWNVAEAAAALRVKKMVFASSVFALGWHESASVYWPKYVPVDEQHPLTPFEAYGLSKAVGEEIVAAASRRARIPAVSLRIMNVIQTDGYFAFPWPTPEGLLATRFVMWPYVDIRDAAVSCRQALEAQVSGHEACFIAAEETRFDAPTTVLLKEFAPHVEVRKPLSGSASVISTAKAGKLLGFRPQFSWRREKARGG